MSNNPILNCGVADTNSTTIALTGDSAVLIRYHSHAKAMMFPRSPDGAAIDLDSCLIRNGGSTGYGTEYTFENVESDSFTFVAADSEGRVGREVITVPMVNYVKLTCNASENKPDATGDITLQCSGEYFNGSFGAYSNTIEVSFRYRKSGGSWSGYYPLTVTTTGNSYAAIGNLGGLDYKASYDFEYAANDRLMAVTSASANVVSKPVFHWGESDVTFEVPVNFNEGVDLMQVNGNLYVGTSGECFLGEGAGRLVIVAPELFLSTDSVLLNGSPVSFAEYGSWTPTLSCSGVYWSQSGWYSKAGNIVTVGFHIKIDCDSGYESSNIVISGLPYTPMQAAAGGGMCSGAYVSAGFNFQCFVAEASGTITTRVQGCNNYSEGNLSTSASGCKYSSSATLTLSGTITYKTF